MEENKKEYEKAIDYIRQLIADGKLQSGSRLPTERTIADTLHISRNSTREALRTLENMGIMESKQGSGNYLVGGMPTKLADIFDMMLLMQQTTPKEICQFRRSIEKSVCDLIIRNPEAELEKIPLVLDTFLASEPDKQIELDRQFHYLLIHSTQNQFLIMLMDAMTDLYRRWINMVLREANDSLKLKLHASHHAMYQSLLHKDLIACMKAIDEHYDLIHATLEATTNTCGT